METIIFAVLAAALIFCVAHEDYFDRLQERLVQRICRMILRLSTGS